MIIFKQPFEHNLQLTFVLPNNCWAWSNYIPREHGYRKSKAATARAREVNLMRVSPGHAAETSTRPSWPTTLKLSNICRVCWARSCVSTPMIPACFTETSSAPIMWSTLSRDPSDQQLKVSQECNIILSQSYEYRQPTPNAVKAAAESSSEISSTATVKVEMTSRFLGLIVVPGQHITKIEVEGLWKHVYVVGRCKTCCGWRLVTGKLRVLPVGQ